jgi:two-component system phosphate regulon sensor histidine kinase PhoR
MVMTGARALQDDDILAATLSALPDPVILIDGRATVLLFNHAAAQVWPSLAQAWPFSFTLRAPAIVEAVEAVLRGAPDIVSDYAERVPVERLYEFRVTAIAAPAGEAPGRNRPAALLAFRDLTQARRLEMMRVDFVANARGPPVRMRVRGIASLRSCAPRPGGWRGSSTICSRCRASR